MQLDRIEQKKRVFGQCLGTISCAHCIHAEVRPIASGIGRSVLNDNDVVAGRPRRARITTVGASSRCSSSGALCRCTSSTVAVPCRRTFPFARGLLRPGGSGARVKSAFLIRIINSNDRVRSGITRGGAVSSGYRSGTSFAFRACVGRGRRGSRCDRDRCRRGWWRRFRI